jgi:hypothetical protein
MIYVVPDTNKLNHYLGSVVGNGHCVPFVQHVAGCPNTSIWHRGEFVKDNLDSVQSGTAIATFHPDTGLYENDNTGRSHAAIFLSGDDTGLLVMDQWVGHPVNTRLICFKDGGEPHADDGDHYYVVEVDL